jgi:hypothetical protein
MIVQGKFAAAVLRETIDHFGLPKLGDGSVHPTLAGLAP